MVNQLRLRKGHAIMGLSSDQIVFDSLGSFLGLLLGSIFFY